MAERSSFVLLDRNLLEWRWFKDSHTLHLWVTLILLANYEDRPFEDIVIPRGGVLTSIGKLAEITGMSVKTVRTALNHLKRANEVASKTTNKYTLLLLNNYDKYQGKGQAKGQTKGKQGANEGQQYNNYTNKQLNNTERNKKESSVPSGAALPDEDESTDDVERVAEVPEAYRDRFGSDVEAFRKWLRTQ